MASTSASSPAQPLDEAHINIFLQRLTALQRLCSYSDPNYPTALLFVSGQDGRYNKGTISILNYLFHPDACGKELVLDGVLRAGRECLEDMVLLVQQSSVSVVWT
jgi:hypothetical protein